MAEIIRIVELDIEIDKVKSKAVETQKNLEQIRLTLNALKKEQKANIVNNKEYTNSLSDLEKQGKGSSKEANILRTKINATSQSITEQSKSIVGLNAKLKNASSEYNAQTKIIQANTTITKKAEQVYTSTDGSLAQLSANLSKNKKLYSNLSKAERDNEKVGGKLLTVIKQQDAEYKNLNKSIGNNNVEVGNYEQAITNSLGKVRIFGVNLGGLANQLGKTKVGMIALSAVTKLQTFVTGASSKSLKIFRLALLGTGIGAIVVLFGSLVSYLTSTQAGINAVNKVLTPLKVIFQSLIGVIQKIGASLFNAFSNPKEAVLSLWESIKTNIVNRIAGVGKVFQALGKIISSGFKTGYKDFANATLQVTTGVTDLIDKTKEATSDLVGFFSEAQNRGKRIEEINQQLSKSEADYKKVLSDTRREYKAQNLIADDITKTTEERTAAALKAIEAAKAETEAVRRRNALEVERIKLEQQSNDTSDEERTKLQEKLNEITDAETAALEKLTTQQNKLNTIRSQATSAAVKEQKALLNTYIAEQGTRAKTLADELKLAQEIAKKKVEILKLELEKKKITQEEYSLAVLQIDNELAGKQAALAVDNAARELQIFKDANQSRIDAGDYLTDELLSQEVRRLDEIAEKEREYQERRLEQGVINQQEYNDAINEVDNNNEENKKRLRADRKKNQDDEDAIDIEIKRLKNEENFTNDFDAEVAAIEAKKAIDIEAAEGNAKAIELIEAKSSKKIATINEIKEKTKLDQTTKALGQSAKLLGENTIAGKAAGIAAATINTYQGVTEVWKAPSVLPEPFNTATKVVGTATTVASGLAAVKKISSVKTNTPKFEQGGLMKIGGKRHSAGGTEFVGSDGTKFLTEEGEFIGVMNRNASRLFMDFNDTFRGNTSTTKRPNYFMGGGVIKPNNINNIASQSIDYELLTEALTGAIQTLPNPVVSVVDITTSQSVQTEVINEAEI